MAEADDAKIRRKRPRKSSDELPETPDPVDIAMHALATDADQHGVARAVLEKHARLIDIQCKREHEELENVRAVPCWAAFARSRLSKPREIALEVIAGRTGGSRGLSGVAAAGRRSGDFHGLADFAAAEARIRVFVDLLAHALLDHLRLGRLPRICRGCVCAAAETLIMLKIVSTTKGLCISNSWTGERALKAGN